MHLLPEWAPQRAVLLTWPHLNTDWAPDLKSIEEDYTSLVHAIMAFEPVIILAYDDAHKDKLVHHLKNEKIFDPSLITILPIPTNDVWIRDYGPITLQNNQSELCYLDFQFNAWGKKYKPEKDNVVCDKLVQHGILDADAFQKDEFVLEGGSIDLTSEGTLLTTRECLLSPARNPDFTQLEIEEFLCSTLGVKNIIWINSGSLEGDDTDSHVDMLVRAMPDGEWCYTACSDRQDLNYAALQALENELTQLPFSSAMIPLVMPSPIYDHQGQQLPASYANFLWVNDGLLVPQYGDKQADALVLGQLRELLPNRKIIGVPCRHLVTQFGSLHCATMQLPSGE